MFPAFWLHFADMNNIHFFATYKRDNFITANETSSFKILFKTPSILFEDVKNLSNRTPKSLGFYLKKKEQWHPSHTLEHKSNMKIYSNQYHSSLPYDILFFSMCNHFIDTACPSCVGHVIHCVRRLIGENLRSDSRHQNQTKIKNNDIAVEASFVSYKC